MLLSRVFCEPQGSLVQFRESHNKKSEGKNGNDGYEVSSQTRELETNVRFIVSLLQTLIRNFAYANLSTDKSLLRE